MIYLTYSDTKKALVDANGFILSDKNLIKIRPTERKEITLEFADITLPENCIVQILGDLDFKTSTPEKVQGTNVNIIDDATVSFTLETTNSYLSWLNTVGDANGNYFMFIQVKVYTVDSTDIYIFKIGAGGIISADLACSTTIIDFATTEDLATLSQSLNNRIDDICSNIDSHSHNQYMTNADVNACMLEACNLTDIKLNNIVYPVTAETLNSCLLSECHLTDTKLNNLCALIDIKINNIEGISGITPEFLNACFLINCAGEDEKLNNLCQMIDYHLQEIGIVTPSYINSCMLLNCSGEDLKLNNLCNLLCSYDDNKYDKVENYKLVLNCDLTKNIFVNVLDCQTYQNITHYCNVLYFIFDV